MRPLLACVRLAVLASAALPGFAESDSYDSTPTQADMPMLGIEMSPPPTPVLIKENLNSNQGVYVQNTFGNTAASRMGIQPGDVILAVNGSQIGSMTDLRNTVAMNQVGDPVQVDVQRNGQVYTMSAPLRAWPTDIPKESIDPASEQRFRDWQKQRQDQQQQQADDLGNRIDQMGKDLGAESTSQSDALQQQLADGNGGERAWQLDYHLVRPDHAALAAAPAIGQALATGASAPAAPHAFAFTWSSLAAPSAP